jgi:hypothetical protein
MTSYPARILCAGKEPELLQSRSAVLRCAGYEAHAATLPDVEDLLHTEEFDLIIVSSWLTESERGPNPFCGRRDAHLRAARTDPRCGTAFGSGAPATAYPPETTLVGTTLPLIIWSNSTGSTPPSPNLGDVGALRRKVHRCACTRR